VVAKQVSTREIAVEIICAAIGRAAGLPIPEPVLLMDHDDVWHYSSVDSSHPNLSQFVCTDDASILGELERWPSLLPAACFDELIANPDRHNGNLLYDGSEFFLIDHGLCIPLGMTPQERSDDYHLNRLLDLQIEICRDDLLVQRTAVGSREWAEFKGRQSIALIESSGSDALPLETHRLLLSFLKDRIAILGDHLYERIKPERQGSLKLNA
jgi:hypothetical protein